MNNISKTIITGAIAILSSTATLAQTAERRSIEVKHADLDLSNEAVAKKP